MQIFRTTEAMRTAAHTHPDLELRHLLTLRIQSLEAFDELPDELACLLQVVVLQAGEGRADMSTALGWPCPAPAPPDFCTPWEVIEAHSRWFELTFVLNDDGSGVVVFVPDTADAELLGMCRRYALPAANP